MQPRTDHKHKQYGHLTMLRPLKGNGAGRGVTWQAICRCGKIREVDANQARRGKIKSCGKCQYSRRTKLGEDHSIVDEHLWLETALREMVRIDIHARRWHIPVEVTTEDLIEILSNRCEYCGKGPDPKGSHPTTVTRNDTLQGFTKTNTIPICKACNSMKRDLNSLEFLDNVARIAIHIAKQRQQND